MGKLRSINTVIWSDTWFEDLDTEEKLFFIYLITNEKTNMLGVYETSIKKMSFETGIQTKKISETITKFVKDNRIKYISNRVVLLNFLKHQRYNTNMLKSAIDCYNELPNELKLMEHNTLSKDSEGFGTLLNHFGRVRKVEVEVEVEKEIEVKKEVKPKSKIFEPPTQIEVENYFTENGYTKESGTKAFEYYHRLNWKDSNNRQVKNWKNKMLGVWFTEKNKLVLPTKMTFEEKKAEQRKNMAF